VRIFNAHFPNKNISLKDQSEKVSRAGPRRYASAEALRNLFLTDLSWIDPVISIERCKPINLNFLLLELYLAV